MSLLLGTSVFSQSISVESFRLLQTDLTANTRGTMERDQNGDIAALIKIITTETGFSFDGGMMGIVKTSQKVSEIWVYVPHGIQRIKLMHQQLGQLEYYFPMPIEQAMTYEMKLATGRVRTIVQDEVAAQFVTFKVTPENSIVTIDGNNPYSLQADGTVSQLLSYGTHTYRVDAPGYFSENGTVEVGRERITREVNLESSHGTVTLYCSMDEAEIYVNGNFVGKGKWTGQLDAAMYQVEIKREGYTTRTTSFTLNAQEEKTVTLPLPQAIYGSISVTSQPIGATVYVDGVEVGTTPLLKNEILTGNRTVEFRMKDYSPVTMVVDIKENELNSISAELKDGFTLSLSSNPPEAIVSIDGTYKGVTPFSVDMSSGDYVLKVTKQGYATYKKHIHLGADNPELSITMTRKILSQSNFYLGGSYELGKKRAIILQAGGYLKNINLEGSYYFPEKVSGTVWWMTNPSSWSGNDDMQYEYSLKGAFSFHAGYGLLLNNRIRFTPQLGVQYNMIYGKFAAYKMGMNQTTYVMSGNAGLRMELAPSPHVGLVCVPSYNLPLAKGDLATKLDESTSFIRDWCGGFSLKLGIEAVF